MPSRPANRLLAAAAIAGSAVFSSSALAGVQVGSSGWEWGNPLPQGNTIHSMAFAGTTGYAAGGFGTLLKTTDGGATWTGLPTGTFGFLMEIQAVDANTIVAGGGCVARRSTDGGQTFSRIAFTPVESTCPTDSALAGISFLSATRGFLLTDDGSVFDTADGGVEFASKTAIPGTRSVGGSAKPTALHMRTANEGYAGTSKGEIFQTLDGGTSWKPVSDTQRAVNDITFVSPTVGYAVGNSSLFLKTSDGGATWVAKDAGSGQDLTSVRCASVTRCVATTQSGTQLVRTVDGGDSFSTPSPSSSKILAAAFASENRVVAAGDLGATVVSDDGGATFSPIGSRLTGSYSGVVAGKQAGAAFAFGSNAALAVTTDGGKTWRRGNVLTSQDIKSVAFPTNNDGYALDVSGGLFRTSTGGQSWKTLDTGSTARAEQVIAPSASTVMVVGPRGIRRSTDGGGSFAAVKGKAVAQTQLWGADEGGAAVFGYGPKAIIRSVDGGKTWKALKLPVIVSPNGKAFKQALRGVDFVSANIGYGSDQFGRVWKTTNGTKTWTLLDGVGTDNAGVPRFSSASKGYLVITSFGDSSGGSGYLLRTDDGGATWRPQFVVSDSISGVATGAGGSDYLLAGSSSLLSTTNGGDRGAASKLTVKAPKSKYKKAPKGSITITGTLKPASGNERVTVSYRPSGATRWQSATATVSSNGTFTTSWRLRKGTNTFVAQWAGDFRSKGAGTKPIKVVVGG